MELKAFFDPTTNTLTYVVFDEKSLDAVVIDPVWDYEPQGSVLTQKSFSEVKDFLNDRHLNPRLILETHAHADHLSASQLFKGSFPNCSVAIGENITVVQSSFRSVFNLGKDFPVNGSQFDRLLKDFETVRIGTLNFKVIPTPGHTPACVSYLFDDILFTGDAMFMPDYGTGRCDFPAGSAETLYDSITKNIFSLPDSTKIFVGHDYQPGGRELAYTTTVGEAKQRNIQLNIDTNRDTFIRFRNDRDKTLQAPRLLFPSVLVNIDAGRLPIAEIDNQHFFKIPVFEK